MQKFPVISRETGNEYLVKIDPYYFDNKGYDVGCIVKLYNKRKIFNKELKDIHCGKSYHNKITIEYLRAANKATDLDYNLINMAKLIVKEYENEILLRTTNHSKL